MNENRIEVNPIARKQIDGTKRLIGATFIFPNRRTIDVYVNANVPDMLTISGDDRLSITPWATNLIRIKLD